MSQELVDYWKAGYDYEHARYEKQQRLFRSYYEHCQRRLLAASEQVREHRNLENQWCAAWSRQIDENRNLKGQVEALEAENARLRARLGEGGCSGTD